MPLTNSRFAVGIDYDVEEGFIYWTDDSMKKIERSRLNGSDQQDVISAEVVSPDGIAIDWISRNIYWIDTGADRIEVTTIAKGMFAILLIYHINRSSFQETAELQTGKLVPFATLPFFTIFP